MKQTFLILSCICLSALLHAADPVASDDFSGDTLSENWAAAKGTWTVKDGKLHGAELPADKHAAVLTWAAKHNDSKVSFAFQLDGSDQFHLSYNHPKGHLFRVVVTKDGAVLRKDKNKKDPKSKSENLARKTGDFSGSHTMTCEVKGDTATVTFDNGVTLSASHPELTKPKTGFRFIVKGTGVMIDDFSIAELK